MKNLLTAIVIFLLGCNIFAQTATQPAGSGTAGDPYQIANLNNLYWVTQNSSSWGSNFIQTADIDASSDSTWNSGAGFSPIGNFNNQFSGVYNGNGHSIKGIFIGTNSNQYGMFGYTGGGCTIENLGLYNLNVSGSNGIGGLVGTNNGTINQCYTYGTVHGYMNTGGIAGFNYGGINYSYSMCSVNASVSFGGLAGLNYGSVNNCFSTGAVSSGGGGLTGAGGGTTINSFWDTQTSGLSSSNTGTGEPTDSMKTQSTFTSRGWDFTNTWTINSNINFGYPYLRNVPPPPNTITVSGNAGVASAVLSYTDGIAKTDTADVSGNYTFSVSYNWTGTVTPSKIGYSFSPTSKSYTNLTADSTNQNYTATPITYTISGNAGTSGTVLSYTDTTVKVDTADVSGNYSFKVSYNWNGTVTPTKAGYTFSPTSKSYTNLTADSTNQNYTATAITYTISGNAGAAGAVLSYTDGTAKTDTANASGNYSFSVSYNWTGTVIPTKTGFTFSPTNKSYTNLTADSTNQNYTATAITYTISGNAGYSGVILSYNDTTAKKDTSGLNGNYSIKVSYHWTGIITPTKTGYTFNPVNEVYSGVDTNISGQNYTAIPIAFTISGNTGVGNVALTFKDTTNKSVSSDSTGKYIIAVSYNWSGSIKPSKTNYKFTPDSISYSNLSGDTTNQNFNAIQMTFTISGNVGIGGAVLSYKDTTTKNDTADSNGNYSLIVSRKWTGVVTPSKADYTFSPSYISYMNMLSDLTKQNYTANIISGVEGIDSGIPKEYNLYQNYPNPFNPSTVIRFALPKESNVKLIVYNILGQEVEKLFEGNQQAGYHQIEFDAANLSSGMYIYRIEANNFVQTKKMMLLK